MKKPLHLYASRIGEMASRTDLFLRRKELKGDKSTYIGIVTGPVANKQLMKMFERKMKIVYFKHNKIAHKAFNFIFGTYHRKNDYYWHTKKSYEIENTKQQIHFTKDEHKKGEEILEKMGIKKSDWFVCFHCRDTFHNDKSGKYRNSNIKDCLKAMKYISNLGGYSIIVGSGINKINSKYKNIVDYPNTEFKSDFMDIYLIGNCKFYVGCSSGLREVAYVFSRPTVSVNIIPLDPPYRRNDIIIFKKIYSKSLNRILTIKERIDFEYSNPYFPLRNIWFRYQERLDKNGLFVVDNTEDEIFLAVKEMYNRLSGQFNTSYYNNKLQEKFVGMFSEDQLYYNGVGLVEENFLKELMIYEEEKNPRCNRDYVL